MNITTKVGDDGLRTIRSVNEFGTLALAVECSDPTRPGHTYWNLAVVHVPDGVSTDPSNGPYPIVPTEAVAVEWVTFLGELVERARRAPIEVETGHDIGLSAACEAAAALFPQHYQGLCQ